MKIISGFEPTRIITKDKGLEENIDVLEHSDHYHRFREDLRLSTDIGITTLRIAVPWHRIEDRRGHFDWQWMDEYMAEIKRLGIDPILDPLHHVSIPSWLKMGFLDEEFVDSYVEFFDMIVKRYPWVDKYTIVNEPVVTTYFCTHEGVWYPFVKGHNNFSKGLDNIEQIFRRCAPLLKGKEHWYVDSAEYHEGTCESSSCFAEKMNHHRFQLLDRLRMCDNPVQIDVLGLDYYPHCEFRWDYEGRIPIENPKGFYSVAKQYVERYKLPVALTETNIRGYITDRQTWFIHMYKQCEKLSKEVDFRGMCWYPLIDCTDWDTLVTEPNRNIDPQGLYVLDQDFNRQPNELTENIKRLNKGQIKIDDFRIYDYLAPMDYLKVFQDSLLTHGVECLSYKEEVEGSSPS